MAQNHTCMSGNESTLGLKADLFEVSGRLRSTLPTTLFHGKRRVVDVRCIAAAAL